MPSSKFIPDPDNQGSFLFAVGPGGAPVAGGVVVRARCVFKGTPSAWAYSDIFALDNDSAAASVRTCETISRRMVAVSLRSSRKATCCDHGRPAMTRRP